MKNELKEHILYKALELFRERGYNNVSMNELCKASNISKGTFYNYYGSKEDLLIEYYNRTIGQFQEMYQKLLINKSYLDKLWICIAYLHQNLEELEPDLFKELIKIDLDRGGIVMSGADELMLDGGRNLYHDMLIELISQAQATGEVRNDVSAEALWQCYSDVLRGIMLKWTALDGGFDRGKRKREQFDIIFSK